MTLKLMDTVIKTLSFPMEEKLVWQSPEGLVLGGWRDGAGAEAAGVRPRVRARPAQPFTPPPPAVVPMSPAEVAEGALCNNPPRAASMAAMGVLSGAPLLSTCAAASCFSALSMLASFA